MKITCQLCGTKFHLEKHDYRCPGCASIYGLDGKYDNSSNHTIHNESNNHNEILGCDYDEDQEDDYELDQEMVEYYQKLREQKTLKAAKEKKTFKTVVITVEIIVIAFFILLPFLGKGYSKLRFEEQRIDENPPIVEAHMNELMDVGDYGVIVTRCYIDDASNWNLPENYVVYAVEYETEEDSKYNDELAEGGYNKYNLHRIVEVYLETEDGPTIAPIERYDASDFMVYEEYKKVDDRLANYIRYDGGILYFVVKDYEKIYGLCFDSYTSRENDEYYKELDKVYLMSVPQWEVE